MSITVVNATRNQTLADRCDLAKRFLARGRGLLGRSGLAAGEGLVIYPEWSVHSFFMRFPIDVVFLDRDLTVIEVVETVPPWRLKGRRGAHAVLEIAAGEASRQGITPTDTLRMETGDGETAG